MSDPCRPAVAVCVALFLLTASAVPSAEAAEAASATPPAGWDLPWPDAAVVAPFAAPPHRYGAGHRGVDLAADGRGGVPAPAAGIVAFSGRVVDRGVVTVDHGGGWVTTLEPVDDAPPAGTAVGAGTLVGVLGSGAHTPPGALHVGLRLHGEYVNPLALTGAARRAVLLPCC